MQLKVASAKVSMKIAWGITGAGHFLKETFDVMLDITKNGGVDVTTYLTAAGVQVVKMYGLWDRLKEISNGKYLQEIITEYEDGPGCPKAGRFLRGIYRALIVSPASGNTVAKVVYGIADTMVTNAIAQAQKGSVPVYIVPTDQHTGFIETRLLYRVERSECKLCKQCPIVNVCPNSAIYLWDGVPHIDLTHCRSCGLCVSACPYGAVKYGEKVRLQARKVDVENVEKLKKIDGVTVLEHPMQIISVIKSIMVG